MHPIRRRLPGFLLSLGMLLAVPPGWAGEADPPSEPKERTQQNRGAKYKRDGQKRKATARPKPAKTGYSDRRSRIDVERPSPEAERSIRREFEREDQWRIAGYAKRREALWEEHQKELDAEVEAQKQQQEALKEHFNSLSAPLTSLGFRMFWMGEGSDSGPVSSAEIDANWTVSWFRAGLSTLFGGRSVRERTEFLFLAHLSAGFQWPYRFSPFLLGRIGMGVLTTERFGTDLSYLLTSVGFDAGVDSWITPWLAISLSTGYERCMMENAHWNSVTYKISIGFWLPKYNTRHKN